MGEGFYISPLISVHGCQIRRKLAFLAIMQNKSILVLFSHDYLNFFFYFRAICFPSEISKQKYNDRVNQSFFIKQFKNGKAHGLP